MDVLGLIGILAGLAFLVAAIDKGDSLVIAAPLATMLVVLCDRLPFIDGMFGRDDSYMAPDRAAAGWNPRVAAVAFLMRQTPPHRWRVQSTIKRGFRPFLRLGYERCG